jgi:hypothetical protein
MWAEGEIPSNEPTSDAFEKIGHGFFAIFGLAHHSVDCVGGKTTSRDVDRHVSLLD